jgi:hypothetical protein
MGLQAAVVALIGSGVEIRIGSQLPLHIVGKRFAEQHKIGEVEDIGGLRGFERVSAAAHVAIESEILWSAEKLEHRIRALVANVIALGTVGVIVVGVIDEDGSRSDGGNHLVTVEGQASPIAPRQGRSARSARHFSQGVIVAR